MYFSCKILSFCIFFKIFCVTKNLECWLFYYSGFFEPIKSVCMRILTVLLAFQLRCDLTCLAFALLATWTQNGLDFIVKVFKNHVASSRTSMSHWFYWLMIVKIWAYFILAYLDMFYLFLIFHLVNNLFYFILFQQ